MSLQEFCAQRLRIVPGHMVRLKEFRDLFIKSLPAQQRSDWGKVEFSRSLWSLGFITGFHHGNKTYIINASTDPAAEPRPPLVLCGENRRIKPYSRG